jgi:hypothetical protein
MESFPFVPARGADASSNFDSGKTRKQLTISCTF